MEVLKEMPRRDPINGTFELTVRCNLKCKMCLFRHDDSENAEIIAKEKTAKEWIDMARQVAEAGTINLLITGGEPMLRPDFCEIYEGIYKQGFIIELYTNATLVNDKIMKTLSKYPPHKIGVTLYGASSQTYEKVCGNAKAFDKTIEGIKRLNQLPSILEIRTTLIKDNVHDIDKIEDIANELIGEKAHVVHSEHVLKPVRGANGKVENCRLTPKENLQLTLDRNEKRIKSFFDERNMDMNHIEYAYSLNKSKDENKRITLLGCKAGMDSYTISWDGKLLGCQILGKFYTEPMKYGFKGAWMQYPMQINLPNKNKKCFECSYSDYCSTCCAIHYAETGDLSGCPSYFYDTAKELKNLINKNT